MQDNYAAEPSSFDRSLPLIRLHLRGLPTPFDSYMEENLMASRFFRVMCAGEPAGYAAFKDDTLFAFHVTDAHYRRAPDILPAILDAGGTRAVQALTHDARLMALLMEWEYEAEARSACFFTDGGRVEQPVLRADRPVFREAKASDMDRITVGTGDFFDRLAERIEAKTIFVLEDGGDLMGCGVVEKGLIHTDCVSIGMITCKAHRQKGVARTILWHLKEWAYTHGLRPIAGCWYYNVLSRRSLESVGMIATGKSFRVRLIEKKALPLRTGNPPGELV